MSVQPADGWARALREAPFTSGLAGSQGSAGILDLRIHGGLQARWTQGNQLPARDHNLRSPIASHLPFPVGRGSQENKQKKSPPRFKGWTCMDPVSRRELPGICSRVSEQPHLAIIVQLLRITKTPGDIGYSIAGTCVGEL